MPPAELFRSVMSFDIGSDRHFHWNISSWK